MRNIMCKCEKLLNHGGFGTACKDDFTHELDGSFNSNLLRSADKVHELVSGSKEFDESMEAIKSDDLPAYYESKEFTKGRVDPPPK